MALVPQETLRTSLGIELEVSMVPWLLGALALVVPGQLGLYLKHSDDGPQ